MTIRSHVNVSAAAATADVSDDPFVKKKVAAIKDTRLMRGEGLA